MMYDIISSGVSSTDGNVRDDGGGTVTVARKDSKSKFRSTLSSKVFLLYTVIFVSVNRNSPEKDHHAFLVLSMIILYSNK